MTHPKKIKHPEHPPVPAIKKEIKRVRVISVAVFIFLLFGVGMAYFAAGDNITWLVVGGLIGIFCGYLFGRSIANGLLKK